MSAQTGLSGNNSVRITQKDVIADDVIRLRLEEPSGKRLPYWTPGAHIDLILPLDQSEPVARQYSLCGDRWDSGAYEIAVLRERQSRGGSAFIHDNLAVGDVLSVGTPRNNFALAQAKRYEFIAGGIGITPIMAMISSADRLGVDWHLLYGGRSRDSMAFLKELEQYGDRVTVCPQDNSGLLDLTYLEESVEGAQVYCCGPEPLLSAVKSASAAWQPGFVRFERFVAATQPAPVRSEPFTVELARSEMSVTVKPNESVLDVLNRVDKPVLSSCRQGICGTCEVSVLCGVPDHRDSLLTDDERAKNDRMFVCVSRSISDRIVLDL